MTPIDICFLNILRCSLEGKPLDKTPGLTSEEWGQLFRLAREHHVLPMVFEAVHRLPELQTTGLLPPLKQTVIRQVMAQTQKSAAFLSLLQKLQKAGVRPLVVKGIICRNLYPLPDHRVSGDEDLLIPPEQSALCHRLLTEAGLVTTLEGERFETDYEVPYRQTGGPLYIELHRHLFPPESESYGDLNRFFRDVGKRAIEVPVAGVGVPTLGHTDHLFYLICHAFKHFLHSGFGIRQVCDIVMYANAHGREIDWQQLLTLCREIRAHLFAAAIFRIGKLHLTFDPEAAGFPEIWDRISPDEGPLLEDLLSSGVFGSSSMSRRHSSSITLDAVAAQKQGRAKGNSVLLSLFPPAGKLKASYPYLKDRPYLLPAAWASRIGKYLLESRTAADNSAADALKIGGQRLALLRKYGVIE